MRRLLHRHRWPGNLRELRNVIEYARAVCAPQGIEVQDLPDDLARDLAAQAAGTGDGTGASGLDHPPATPGTVACAEAAAPGSAVPLPPEAQALVRQLRAAHWNITAVARDSGLSRMTLYRRMKRWGISSPVHADSGEAG